MLKLLFILSLVFMYGASSALGQDSLTGKWYMFSRNRMVELNIQQDQLISKQVNWDMSYRYPVKSDTQMIEGTRRMNGNMYLYQIDKRHEHKFLLCQ